MACSLRRKSLSALDPFLPVRVRLDQAGVDCNAFAADQTLVDAATQDSLEQASQQIAIAEAAMSLLREGRMVGHIAIEPEPAKPTIGKIEVNLLAQASLGADAEPVAYDQHPDHQFRID
jgi:hypothetical protein